MFVGFFSLVFGLGERISTLGLPAITQALRGGGAELGSLFGFPLATVAFVLMFFGFAVKVPVFPVHTWLPDAHVEAPTPVSVMLAGVLLKMGTYALLRFNFTMLSDVAISLAPYIGAIGVLSVIYGAMLALAQRDLKRIVAYSSISSMGYVILGLVAFTPHGVGGATFQMISHGLISGLMFMAVGVIYNETHTRMIGDMSGLADRMPWTVGIFVSAAFGYMGLPLMSGFAAEVLVFLGSFGATETLGTRPGVHRVGDVRYRRRGGLPAVGDAALGVRSVPARNRLRGRRRAVPRRRAAGGPAVAGHHARRRTGSLLPDDPARR